MGFTLGVTPESSVPSGGSGEASDCSTVRQSEGSSTNTISRMVWHRVPGAPQCQSQRPHAAGRHHHSSAGLLTLRNKKLSQDPVRNLHSQEINLNVLGRWMPQDCASRVETLVGAAFGGTAAAPPEPCIAELKHPPQLNKPESGEQLYRFICTYTRVSCWHRGLPGDGTCFLQAQHDLFQPGLQPRCLSCPVTPGLTTTSFTITAHRLKEKCSTGNMLCFILRKLLDSNKHCLFLCC